MNPKVKYKILKFHVSNKNLGAYHIKYLYLHTSITLEVKYAKLTRIFTIKSIEYSDFTYKLRNNLISHFGLVLGNRIFTNKTYDEIKEQYDKWISTPEFISKHERLRSKYLKNENIVEIRRLFGQSHEYLTKKDIDKLWNESLIDIVHSS